MLALRLSVGPSRSSKVRFTALRLCNSSASLSKADFLQPVMHNAKRNHFSATNNTDFPSYLAEAMMFAIVL